MSAQSNTGEYSSVCSYLGLADDADSHATYPTEAHRCYRLPNPTRIAANHQESFCLGAEHVNCPVFQGDGLPRPTGAPAGVAAAGTASATSTGPVSRPVPTPPAAGELRPKGPSPFGANRPSTGAPGRAGTAGRPPGQRRAGQLNGPRPRAGGISMPVLTIALFALAGVVLAVAFVIQSIAGGGDDDGQSPADLVAANATNTVIAQTATAVAGGQSTPGEGTATTSRTPEGDETPGTTPGTGGSEKTYTVEGGDNCATIANTFGISTEEFFDLNPSVNTDCTNLGIGQVVNIAR